MGDLLILMNGERKKMYVVLIIFDYPKRRTNFGYSKAKIWLLVKGLSTLIILL